MTSPARENEVSPDSLMAHFRGCSLKRIVVFTLAVHAAVLVGSSIPFLWSSVFRGDVNKVDKDVRMEKAMADATASLRKIAAENGLDPQEISRRFSGGAAVARPAAPAAVAPTNAAPTNTTAVEATAPAAEPEKPKSTIEKALEVKTPGPELPSVGDPKDDIF
jgi:hypothetical protein